MREILALILLLWLMGCEAEINWSLDGVNHTLVINPDKESIRI